MTDNNTHRNESVPLLRRPPRLLLIAAVVLGVALIVISLLIGSGTWRTIGNIMAGVLLASIPLLLRKNAGLGTTLAFAIYSAVTLFVNIYAIASGA